VWRNRTLIKDDYKGKSLLCVDFFDTKLCTCSESFMMDGAVLWQNPEFITHPGRYLKIVFS
jgi:hypothetical protein